MGSMRFESDFGRRFATVSAHQAINGTTKSAMSIGVTARHCTRRTSETPAARVSPPSTDQKTMANMIGPNDEVERREVALPSNEADLSKSSIPSLAQRRRHPRSLEPIVRLREAS